MSIVYYHIKLIISGGGIIGSCTAYYLTRHPLYDPQRDSITIIEASKIAAAASGKAGGLIASWGQFSRVHTLRNLKREDFS